MRGAAAGAIALLLATGCGSSAGGEAGSGVVSSQQAGGDTAWARSLEGGASALAVAPLAGGRVAVAVGTLEGAGTHLQTLDATGAVAWSRALAAPCTVNVQPLGVVSSGALALLASAPCAPVVAALGPEPLPASGALVLLDPEGAPLGRIGLAADLAAVVAAAVTSSGEVAVLARASRPVVALVGADGERWRWELDGAQRVAAAPSGDVVVAAGTAPVQLTRIGRDGTGAWSTSLPGGFSLDSLAVLTDGAVAALGSLDRPVSWGRGAAGGADGSHRALLLVEPDGTPRTAADVAPTDSGAKPAVVALPHGRILLHRLAGCDRLRALSPQLEAVWERAVDAGCAASVSAVALSEAGQIVLVGSIRGAADFGSGYAIDGTAGAPSPFALALWP